MKLAKKFLLDLGFVSCIAAILMAIIIPVLLESGRLNFTEITSGGLLFMPTIVLGICVNSFWIYCVYYHVKSGGNSGKMLMLIFLSVLYLPFYYISNREVMST